MTTMRTDKVRFEGITSPRGELRYDATDNELTVGKGSKTPPCQTIGQEAKTFAQQVAQGCWTASGDTLLHGRSATLYKMVAATSGPCRGDARVGRAIVDKATGAVLQRETGQADARSGRSRCSSASASCR